MYRLSHHFGFVNDSFELSFKAKEVKLDIFFFYEEVGITTATGTAHTLFEFTGFERHASMVLSLLRVKRFLSHIL
jgi:hypothetical protein